MTYARNKSLPFNAAVDRHYVFLVWGVREHGGQKELIAIATTLEARNRYLKAGRIAGFVAVKAEHAWLDHMYGESLSATSNR